MAKSPYTKQPLPGKQKLIGELLRLAQAQLQVEGGKLAEQPFDETTSFSRAGFRELVWSDFLCDVTAGWLIDDDGLPPEPDASLNCIRLAEHLLSCAAQRRPSPLNLLENQQQSPPTVDDHSGGKGKGRPFHRRKNS